MDEEFPWIQYEFYPGDVVEAVIENFSSGGSGKVARKLIKAGNWPNRKLKEFKFRATLGQLTINSATAEFYKEEIKRVRAEIDAGDIIYPNLIEVVEMFEKL